MSNLGYFAVGLGLSRRHGGGAVWGGRDARGADVLGLSRPVRGPVPNGQRRRLPVESGSREGASAAGRGRAGSSDSARFEPAHVRAIAARRARRRTTALVRNRTIPAPDSWPGRVRDWHGIDDLGHAGQPFLLERGALAARPGPTRRYSRTLPAGAPPGLLRWAVVAAEHRHSAWLLDCHCPDPAHLAPHGPTHLDRGAHARQC